MDKLTKYTQVEHLQKTNELVDKVNELKPVATSGSYNDLTDVPVLDNDAITKALGYTPLNADEGGTVNGDINLVSGNYLINGEELESGINLLKRNKEYAAGDIAFSNSFNSQLHLKCIVAGTTAEIEPEDLSSKVLNNEFTDGTVIWKVVKYTNQLENYLLVGKEEDIDQDLLHENVIIVDPDELSDPLSFSEMTGATDSESGMGGTVPAPEAGSSNRFLAADATWKSIDVPEASNNLSDYTNDVGFITEANVPSNVSELTNDTGFITAANVPTTVSSFVNDANYVTTTQLSAKADINNPTFTGTVTVPKIVTTTGIEIY